MLRLQLALDVHTGKLTKCSGLDENVKGNVLLGNLTVPEDSAEILELLTYSRQML